MMMSYSKEFSKECGGWCWYAWKTNVDIVVYIQYENIGLDEDIGGLFRWNTENIDIIFTKITFKLMFKAFFLKVLWCFFYKFLYYYININNM